MGHSMTLVVIGGWSDSDCVKSVEGYICSKNQWTALCEMPDSRSHSGAAVVGGKVYVVGGMDWNQDSTKSVCV